MSKRKKKKETLRKSTRKHERRLKGRKRQFRKYDNTGKTGHRKMAGKHGRAARKLAGIIEKIKGWFRRNPRSGTGPWDGTQSIIENEVLPVARKWGIPVTSTKRWETYGNPGSDHYMGNTNAYAVDFATANNYALAAAIGKALGVAYNGPADDYRNFYLTRAGKRYRFQAIAGTHGTGPHLHIGLRRA